MTDFWWISNSGLVERLGWTLLHFLWQGVLAAIVLSLLMGALRKCSAASRYGASLLCLVLLALAPLVTFSRIHSAPVLVKSQPLELTPAGTFHGPEMPVPPASASQAVPKAEPPSPPFVEVREVPRVPLRERASAWLTPWLPVLVAVWLGGVFLLSIHHLAGWVTVQRLRKRYVEPVTGHLTLLAEELRKKLAIIRAVNLVKSALIDSPVTIGWLKPVILLPASALTGLTPRQLEAILAHELAHILRHDYLVNLLQTVIETLLFYHPAVWWISKRIRIERENCCDDIAVAVCGDAVTYARALAELEQLRGTAGFAMAASSGSLLDRVRRLASLRSTQARGSRDSWWVGVPVALLAIGLVLVQYMPMASSKAEKEPASPPWIKTLPSGVEVELIGISTHPSRPDSWWKPDGGPLTPAPYADDGSTVTPGVDERAYEFAVQLRNVPADFISTRMQAIPWGSSAGGGSDTENAVAPHTRAVAVSIPKDIPECGLRVRVAAGQWETVIDYKRNSGDRHWPSSSQNGDKGQFAFASPLESEGKAVFTLTHSLVEVDYRVAAIDNEGQLHQTIRSDSQNVGPLIQTTATFDLPLADIDHFEFQGRPYEWIEFAEIPLKVTSQYSLLDTIPTEMKGKLNPKYLLSFPLVERRPPTADEEALLTRIFDRHRQIKDVKVDVIHSTFSLTPLQEDANTIRWGGTYRIENMDRLHLPDTGHTVARVAGYLGEQKAQYVRIGDHWWADVSQLMGVGEPTQAGFDGKTVWFRFGHTFNTIPVSMVDTFDIHLAAPMGLELAGGEARQDTICLGEEDYNGPCVVFARQREGCPGSDTQFVDHYYFTEESLLLNKIESFCWTKDLGGGPSFIFSLDDYTFEESPAGIEPALFKCPLQAVSPSSEVAFPGPGELTVGLSDGSNGNMQASYRLKYEGGSWGSGLN